MNLNEVISGENWYVAKQVINDIYRDRFQQQVRDEYIDAFARWIAFRKCSLYDLHLLMAIASEKFGHFPTIAQFSELLEKNDHIKKVKGEAIY